MKRVAGDDWQLRSGTRRALVMLTGPDKVRLYFDLDRSRNPILQWVAMGVPRVSYADIRDRPFARIAGLNESLSPCPSLVFQ